MKSLLALLGFFVLSLFAHAQNERTIDAMTDKHIQEIAKLTGQEYLLRRNEFLALAPLLPEYPFDTNERDPYYRVQYQILLGWQRHADLYQKMTERLENTDVEFMSNSAAGFHPLYNETRELSATEWRYDGLAYAWEDITKFTSIKPLWQIQNSIEIINGFPHVDSIDPLLIAALPEQDRSWRENWHVTLSNMPDKALQQRLQSDVPFYQHVHSTIQEALRRQ